MSLQVLIVYSLGYGAILSGAMSILILGSLRTNAEIWVGDYPPDIRERYGPISKKGRKQKILFSIPILLTPIAIAVGLLAHLHAVSGSEIPFWSAALGVFIMGSVFNVFDLVVIDWFLFVRVQPKFIILPGTEGMPGYRDYFFHFKAFLVGVVLSGVISVLAAGGYRFLAE